MGGENRFSRVLPFLLSFAVTVMAVTLWSFVPKDEQRELPDSALKDISVTLKQDDFRNFSRGDLTRYTGHLDNHTDWGLDGVVVTIQWKDPSGNIGTQRKLSLEMTDHQGRCPPGTATGVLGDMETTVRLTNNSTLSYWVTSATGTRR